MGSLGFSLYMKTLSSQIRLIISSFNPSSCTFWSPSLLPRAEGISGLLPPNSGFSSLGISTLTSVTTTPNLRKVKGGSLQTLLHSEVSLFSSKELHTIKTRNS